MDWTELALAVAVAGGALALGVALLVVLGRNEMRKKLDEAKEAVKCRRNRPKIDN